MQQLEQHEQQRVVGRPFRPGQSGNPAGTPAARRYRETFAALDAEFGPLTPSQRVLVDEIARLKAASLKRDRVRTARAIAGLLEQLIALKRAPAPKDPRQALEEHCARIGGGER